MITYMEMDTEKLNADIRELEIGTAKMKSSLRKLQEEMEELNGMWKGKANMAFRRQVNLDFGLMSAFLEKLDRLAVCMSYASNEYARCEQEIKSDLNRVQIQE